LQAERATTGGWRGNPLLLANVLLGVIGMCLAGYLTYVHYNEDALVCTVGGCETVQQSDYSTMLGVPIAIFGFLMFLTVTLLALARMTDRGPIPSDMATMAAWTLLLTSLLYYAYLTYVEIWELEAVCQWCVMSSIVTLLMFVLESVLLTRELRTE
jgi:uncharacterized membrane protein